jgi:choline dehydrogenase-like flavoprotein
LDASVLPRAAAGDSQAPCAVIGEWATGKLERARGL